MVELIDIGYDEQQPRLPDPVGIAIIAAGGDCMLEAEQEIRQALDPAGVGGHAVAIS